MSAKVMHVCDEAPEGLLESLSKNHGWDRKEIPLTVERRRDGETMHPTCPYCGEETKDMEHVPADDANKLDTNNRARGSMNRPGATQKSENAGLLQEIKAMREEMKALRKSTAKSDKKGASE